MNRHVKSKYLNLYNNSNGLNDLLDDNEVSYCIENNDLKFHDYSKDYLTFEILEDGPLGIYIPLTISNVYNYIEYSKDNGQTWTKRSVNANSDQMYVIIVNKGEKILWRGSGTSTGISEGPIYDENNKNLYFWSPMPSNPNTSPLPAKVNIYGNIMSLLYLDDFQDKNMLNNNQIFSYLFGRDSQSWTSLFVVNAENLILPTNLSDFCFTGLFKNCSQLIKAPNLYAKTLKRSCYYKMFYGCDNLIKCPKLEFDTIDNRSDEYCCSNMFNYCSKLIDSPSILKPQTLSSSCYESMFANCISLKNAPTLPAKELLVSCYRRMFQNCYSLKIGPSIFAISYVSNHDCEDMFSNCYNLSFIRTNLNYGNLNWVQNVNSNGIIMCPYEFSLETAGPNTFPTTWKRIYMDHS